MFTAEDINRKTIYSLSNKSRSFRMLLMQQQQHTQYLRERGGGRERERDESTQICIVYLHEIHQGFFSPHIIMYGIANMEISVLALNGASKRKRTSYVTYMCDVCVCIAN